MSKGNNLKFFNIIDNQIEHLDEPLKMYCENLIEGLPKGNSEEIGKYLVNFFKRDYSISHVITPIVMTTSKDPFKAFDLVNDNFPDVDINSTKKPTSKGLNKFIERIKVVDWTNKTQRIVVKLFIEFVKAFFVTYTYHNSSCIDEESANDLFIKIANHAVNTSANDSDLCYDYIACSVWGRALRELSIISAEEATKHVVGLIHDAAFGEIATKPNLFCMKLALLSNVVVRKLSKSEIDDVKKSLKNANRITKKIDLWSIAKHAPSTSPLHIQSIAFLSNFYAEAFRMNPSLRDDSFIENGYKKVCKITDKNYIGPAIGCRARMASYCQNSKIKVDVYKYYETYIKPALSNNEHAGHALEEIHWLLNGECEVSTPIVRKFIEGVLSNTSAYSSFQDELARVLVSISKVQPELFYETLASKITDASFSKNNIDALFNAGFSILLPDGLYIEEESELRETLGKVVSEYLLDKIKSIESTNCCYYDVMSFIDSICYHNTTYMALFYTLQESVPFGVRLSYNQTANGCVEKWNKALKAEYSSTKTFNDTVTTIKMLNQSITDINETVRALHLYTLTNPTKRTIRYVVPYIFSKISSVSAAACRCIQAIIIMNPSLFEPVAERIMSVFTDKLLISEETLATGILAIKLLFETIKENSTINKHEGSKSKVNVKNSVTKELVDFTNAVFTIGLCAPNPMVRSRTVRAAKFVSEVLMDYSTIGNFINKNDTIISYTASINALHSLNYINAHITKHIKFSDFAGSFQNQGFSFFLAVFAKLLAKSEVVNDGYISFSKKLMETCSVKEMVDTFYIFRVAFEDDVISPEFNKLMKKVSSIASKNETLSKAIISTVENLLDYLKQRSYLDIIKNMYSTILYGMRNEINSNDDDFIEENQSLILDVLSLFFSYLPNSIEKLENASSDKVTTLNSLLEFSSIIFEGIFRNKIKDDDSAAPAGMYARVQAVNDDVNLGIDPKRWFILSTNLIEHPQIKAAAEHCLTALFALFPLPNECSKIFEKQSSQEDKEKEGFVEHNILFKNCCPLLISRYRIRDINVRDLTNKAPSDPKYFHAIAEFFPTIESDILYLQEEAALNYTGHSESESEFCNNIHESAGIILALAFNYLICNDADCKKSAIRVIRAMALGVAAIYCDEKSFADVYRNTIEITEVILRGIHGSSINPAIEISTLLHKRIPMIGDQFVKEMLTLATKKPILARIVEPWLEKVIFTDLDSAEQAAPVIVGTDREFQCYTAYSFTEDLLQLPRDVLVLSLMRSAIEGQAEDSYDIAHFFVIDIILNHIFYEKFDGFDLTLTYLFMVKPDVVLKDIMNFFRVSFFNFMNVSNSEYETLNNLDKFLSSEGYDFSQYMSDNFTICEYEEIIPFMLKLLSKFVQQSPKEVKEFSPELTIFASIIGNEFKEDLKPLEKIIPEYFQGEEEVLEYFKNLPEEVSTRAMTQVLAWGLCCPFLDKASKALNIFIKCANKFDADTVIDKAVRVLYITSTCLYEKTNGINKAGNFQFSKAIMFVPNSGKVDSIIKYIANVLNVIEIAINKTKTPHVNVMWIAASFTQYSCSSNNVILDAAIRVIIAVLQNKEARKELRKHGKNNNEGILTQISRSKFDTDTPQLVFELSSILRKKSLKDLALSESDATSFVFNSINAIADVTGNSESVINDLMTCGSTMTIGKDGANTAFRIFGQIAAVTTGPSRHLIFDICSKFITLANCEVDDLTVSVFMSSCGALKELSAASDKLFMIINSKMNSTEEIERTRKSKTVYPKIKGFAKYDFNEKYDNIDIYESPENFPPLFVDDRTFYNCPIESLIRSNIVVAPIHPFTEWMTDIYRAKSKEFQHNMDRSAPFDVDPTQEYFNKVREILKEDEIIFNEDEIKEAEESTEVVSDVKEHQSIDWSPFLPSLEFVSSIANNICGKNAPTLL